MYVAPATAWLGRFFRSFLATKPPQIQALGSMSNYSSIYLSFQLWKKTIITIFILLIVASFAVANFPIYYGVHSGKIITKPELSATSLISAVPAGRGGGLNDGKNYSCTVMLEDKRVVKANCYKYNFVNQNVNVNVVESLFSFFSTYRVKEPNK